MTFVYEKIYILFRILGIMGVVEFLGVMLRYSWVLIIPLILWGLSKLLKKKEFKKYTKKELQSISEKKIKLSTKVLWWVTYLSLIPIAIVLVTYFWIILIPKVRSELFLKPDTIYLAATSDFLPNFMSAIGSVIIAGIIYLLFGILMERLFPEITLYTAQVGAKGLKKQRPSWSLELLLVNDKDNKLHKIILLLSPVLFLVAIIVILMSINTYVQVGNSGVYYKHLFSTSSYSWDEVKLVHLYGEGVLDREYNNYKFVLHLDLILDDYTDKLIYEYGPFEPIQNEVVNILTKAKEKGIEFEITPLDEYALSGLSEFYQVQIDAVNDIFYKANQLSNS